MKSLLRFSFAFSNTLTMLTTTTTRRITFGIGGIEDPEVECAFTLKGTLPDHDDVHITPEIAKALYMRVDRLGEGDKIKSLSNEDRPEKMACTLEILDMRPRELTFCGYNGYFAKFSKEALAKLNKIVEDFSLDNSNIRYRK